MGKQKEKGAGGRPSKYQPEYARQALTLCKLGAVDADLAEAFGVCEDTINAWKRAHSEFSESLKAGKAYADAKVVSALHKRACGYEHTAVKLLVVSDGGNKGSHVEQVTYVERYPPDTTACIFWLKNRRKSEWRDRQEVQHDGDDSILALIAQSFNRPEPQVTAAGRGSIGRD